jgi:hypothetical protein
MNQVKNTISSRIIRACLDYAFINNLPIEQIVEKYNYTSEYLEDTYNWVSIDFFNEIINYLEINLNKNNVALDIGLTSSTRTSWGDIENVIKIIGKPKLIIEHLDRFTSYFFKTNILKIEESTQDTIIIKQMYSDETHKNVIEFLFGTIISIPKLWGEDNLSAVRIEKGIKIDFTKEPSFFDLSTQRKDYSPKFLEEIIYSLEKTKNTIEAKNKLLRQKNEELQEAYIKLEANIGNKTKEGSINSLLLNTFEKISESLELIKEDFDTLKPSIYETNSDKKVKSLFESTDNNLKKISIFLKEINSISKINESLKTDLNIKDIVKKAINLITDRDKIEIVENYDHKSLIKCNEPLMVKVIFNLLLNSIQSIKEGKITISTKENENVELTIESSGKKLDVKDIDILAKEMSFRLILIESILEKHSYLKHDSKKGVKTTTNIIMSRSKEIETSLFNNL